MKSLVQLLCDATPKDGWDIIGTLAPVLIAGLAIWFGYLQAKKAISGDKHLEERKEIYHRLNNFYGPILQYLQKSGKLYKRFKIRFAEENTQFRSITYFIENGTGDLTSTEKDIFDEIIRIGTNIEKIVFKNSGLVMDKELTKAVLSDYTTHLYFLQLAYSGRLAREDPTEYIKYAFPRDIEAKVIAAKERLEARLESLNTSM